MNKPNNTTTTKITSKMAGIIIMVVSTTLAILFVAPTATNNTMMLIPAYAGIDPDQEFAPGQEVDPDDVFGSEKECAEKFDPWSDRENYLGCTGGIGTP